VARGGSTARDGMRSVTRGTLILLVGTLGFVGANFIGRVLLVRDLSAGEFDEFYIALTLAGLLTALGQLGLPPAIARSIPYARSDAERRGLVRSALRITLPLALGAGAALFLLSGYLGREYGSPLLGTALAFFAVGVTSSILASQIAAIFQGFEDVRPNAIFLQLLNPLLFIVFLILSQSVGPTRFPIGGARELFGYLLPNRAPLGFEGALGAYVLASGIALVGLIVYYRLRAGHHLRLGAADPRMTRRLLAFAAPLFLVGVFNVLATSLDTLLLGYYHNDQAGNYGAALSLARLSLVGLGALGYILLPVIARYARDRDTDGARVIYATATKWMILTSLPLFLVFVFYPGPSLQFVYKASYAQSTLPLQLLVTGAFASTLIGPAGAAQVSFGQTRALLYNTVAAAAADGILAVLLVPSMGAVGAAIAWAATAALLPALSVVELGITLGVHPFLRNYLVALLGTSVPIALLLGVVPTVPSSAVLILFVLAIAFAFVLVVLLTRSIDEGDRLLLEAAEAILGRPIPGVRWLARRFHLAP
jgi:O-antigen/teichoic acid export membrane protein